MMFLRGRGMNYVEREDRSGYDFTISNFTRDGNWHTLDLSAIVPANVKAVFIKAQALTTSTNKALGFRKYGYTGAYTNNVLNIITSNQHTYLNFGFVPVDSSGRIEYYMQTADVTGCNVIILGWLV